jgi:hypothetical protein
MKHRIHQLAPHLLTAPATFAVSVLIVLLFWMIMPTSFRLNESSDYTDFYEPVARNILAGRGLIQTDGAPAIRYPPGYPVLLAGVFGFSHLIRVSETITLASFILLCTGLSSVFLFMLARSVWSPLAAFASSLIWITYPFSLWLTKQPNSEIVFMAVFYGGFCLFWHLLLHKSRAWPIYFFSGLLSGFAMLIRPVAIGIGFLMGTILWLVGSQMSRRLRLFLAMMTLLGNFTAIFPWEAWVYSKAGTVVVLSSGGVPSIVDGLTFALVQIPNSDKSYRELPKVPHDVAALMQDISGSSAEMNSFEDVISVIIGKLGTQPLTVTKIFAVKTARSWYGTDSGRFETPIMLLQSVYVIMVLWATGAAWRQGGLAKQLAISIWLIVFYFWGMTILVLSILRYMVPVIGLLFVLLPASFSTGRVVAARPT